MAKRSAKPVTAAQARPIAPDRQTPAGRAAALRAANASLGITDDEIDTEAEAEAAEAAPKPRGRPPGRKPATVARPVVTRAPMRGPIRQPVLRDKHGRVAALGRDGILLSRKVTETGDIFHIDNELIPAGWTYQWITSQVIGKSQKISHFMQNGWTPVPASRHPGLFMPLDYEGAIEQEGLMLVERPKVLTDDARREEMDRARNLLRVQNDQFRPKLPGARSQPGTGLRAKRTIEGLPPDVDAPGYEIDAEDGLV